MLLHRRSLKSVLLAALIVAIALAFGAARADAAPSSSGTPRTAR
jgi:hypothetical protein